MTGLPAPSEALKRCCADFYQHQWVTRLVGQSLHPGGLNLTEELGNLLDLGPHRRVLDLACGRGASAWHLARRFGCRVIGVDMALEALRAARRGSSSQVRTPPAFLCADAEALPFPDQAFDVLLCECSFCLFPSKQAAARELLRVLRSGGCLGLTDLALDPEALPPSLRDLAGYVSCLATALPAPVYVQLLEQAGFGEVKVEDRRDVLWSFLETLRVRLAGLKVAVALGKGMAPLPDINLERVREVLEEARQFVMAGHATYVVLQARKP